MKLAGPELAATLRCTLWSQLYCHAVSDEEEKKKRALKSDLTSPSRTTRSKFLRAFTPVFQCIQI